MKENVKKEHSKRKNKHFKLEMIGLADELAKILNREDIPQRAALFNRGGTGISSSDLLKLLNEKNTVRGHLLQKEKM